MALIMGLDRYDAECYVMDANDRNGELHNLFYPPKQFNWSMIKPEWAIAAIYIFLRTGKAQWRKAIPLADQKRILEDGCALDGSAA
jgi:hypothetical protein